MNRCFMLSLRLLLLAIVVVIGCDAPPGPMKFNNMMSRANTKMSEAAKKYYKAIEPLKDGKQADAAAQGAYSDMQKALADAKKEFDELPAPAVPGGVDTLAKYKAFISSQESIFNKTITPINNIVKDGSLGPFAKWGKINPLLNQASTEDSNASAPLQKALEEYRKGNAMEVR